METHMATVFDPHPGEGGCITPLPESLRIAASAMNGQRLAITEIIERLQQSVSDGAFKVSEDYIGYGNGKQVYVPCASPGMLSWTNNWRVIRIER